MLGTQGKFLGDFPCLLATADCHVANKVIMYSCTHILQWCKCFFLGGGGGAGLKIPEKVGSGVKIFQPPLVSVLIVSCYWMPPCAWEYPLEGNFIVSHIRGLKIWNTGSFHTWHFECTTVHNKHIFCFSFRITRIIRESLCWSYRIYVTRCSNTFN